MDASPLQRLPPKLRNHIYELYFAQESIIRLRTCARVGRLGAEVKRLSDGGLRYEPLHHHALALSATCRQIRNESTKLFYACNDFEIPMPGYNMSLFVNIADCVVDRSLEAGRLFLDAIGLENAAALRSMAADMGVVYVNDLEGTGLDRVVSDILRYLHKLALRYPQ